MKERKLLESKLLGARRRVSLYVSPLALCFDMENGVVTTECEALGFGVSSHRKLKDVFEVFDLDYFSKRLA